MTLNSSATKMAEYIMKKANISQRKKAVFVYGCELTLSTAASILSIIFFSILLNAVYSSFVFLFIFMGIRFFSGGYHAKTYFHCFLLTNFVYILSFLFSKHILILMSWTVKAMLLFGSAIIIVALATIRHKKHPLTEQIYQKNARIARIITVLITLVAISLLIKSSTSLVLTMIVVTLMATAIMMIIPKFQEGVE